MARYIRAAALFSWGLFWSVPAGSGQTPLSNSFTYQGQLKHDGVSVNGLADFRFSVWDAQSGGQQIGVEYQVDNASVANGLFTVRVDPGANVFSGNARWILVSVRFPAAVGSFTALLPRQPLTAAPYTFYSGATRGINVAQDGRVGLGTASPKQSLHVVGDYYGRGHLWLHAFEGDVASGTAYVQARDDSGSSTIDLRLRTQLNGAAVDALTLKSSGNVGVGTTSPQHKFDTAGTARFSAAAGPNLILHDSNGGPDRPGIQFTNNSQHFIAGDDDSDEAFGFYSKFSNQRTFNAMITIHGNSTGTAGTWNRYLSLTHTGIDGKISTDTGHLLLQPAGNVGIATNSPQSLLHVGSSGANWNWASGNGWGDFSVSNGTVGLAMGIATAGGGMGDVRLWTRGGTERLLIGNPTDGIILQLDDRRVGVADVDSQSRLNVTSLALTAPSPDWSAHFKDANGSGEAWLAGDDGQGREYGIEARGGKAGGFFKNTGGSAEARAAYSSGTNTMIGLWARGEVGGYFESSSASGSIARLGGVNAAVDGTGKFGGGYFGDTDDSGWAEIGSFTYKVRGNGGVSFVQNHPGDRNRVIVYTAPEGDEVATYTRGTARLINGEAIVSLGETFRWVTNPEIGLTAHLTPRGDCQGLFVESLTTSELVVRELRGGTSDVAFDYIVHGLRIGFEEVSTVQEKTREAPIPSMAGHLEQFARRPELRHYNALERFKAMNRSAGIRATLESNAAADLRDAIQRWNTEESTVRPDGLER